MARDFHPQNQLVGQGNEMMTKKMGQKAENKVERAGTALILHHTTLSYVKTIKLECKFKK